MKDGRAAFGSGESVSCHGQKIESSQREKKFKDLKKTALVRRFRLIRSVLR